MITLNTCHAVHPPYGTLKCPAGRGQPQFLKHFPDDAPRTTCDGAVRPTSSQALLCDKVCTMCPEIRVVRQIQKINVLTFH